MQTDTQTIEQLDGYDEVLQKFLDSLAPEQRLEGLAPEERLALAAEETVLAVPDAVLRALPEAFVATLPASVQRRIRERLGG